MSTNSRPLLRVLLIEDSSADGELVERELHKAGYKVILQRVETEAALQLAIDEAVWDVVICDYVLPRFSALKALQIVHGSLVQDYLPFIIISGAIDESVAIETLKSGAHDFIDKGKLSRLGLAIKRELRAAGARMQQRIEIEENYQRTIEAWGKAMELRDHFTSGHTQRVTDLTLRLTRRLDISKTDFANIHRGALLHDVGKMGIPDAVLLKPGALDRDEQKIMQMHPQLAYDMLSPIPFLRPAINIPYCHHEHWDGSGYPRGLAGREIPREARIFAVVDVYDALRSDRPYRKSWTPAAALAYLQEQRGMLFEPAVVDSFASLIREGDDDGDA